MKTSVISLALVIGCATGAHAAQARDADSGAAGERDGRPAATVQIKDAVHRMERATARALHRADAALQRMVHKDKGHAASSSS